MAGNEELSNGDGKAYLVRTNSNCKWKYQCIDENVDNQHSRSRKI